MEVKTSEMKFKGFTVLESSCEWNMVDPKDMSNISMIQDSYPIDLSLNVNYDPNQNATFIFLTLNINNEKKTGYSIHVNCCGIFSFDKDCMLSEEEQHALLQNSGTSICITNLRSYIAEITAYYPMGKYNFPLVDLQSLWSTSK